MEDSVSAGPHQTEASSYLREHRIMELLHNLTSALVYHKPADPKAYMREYIEQLQRAKSDPDQVEVPCLIDESNIKSVFSMLDITKKGYISLEQYTAAMSSLRVAKYNVKPAGWEFNKISQETFARETRTALRNNTATYADH